MRQDSRVTGDHQRNALTVRAPGGRNLDVQVAGPPDGLPLVFHHGTPSGIAVYQPMLDAAVERGLRLVLYARPGYSTSTPLPNRTIADVAGDVTAILDTLGASEFLTAGWSGGGPHSIACAELLPARCLAAASLAGVAPYRVEGLDWLAGMDEDTRNEFSAALAGEKELTALLEEVAPLMRELTAEVLVAGIGEMASPADMQELRGPLAGYIAELFRSGLSEGITGWRDDDLAFVRDWGFSFGQPGEAAPVAIWQGDEDRMVPFAHGQWLARHIPAAHTHFSHGTGHLHLPFGDVFDELLELARQR